MTAATLPATPLASRAWGTRVTLTIAGLAALIFIALVAAPYYAWNEARFGVYWPRRLPLILHISGGIVAILSGPVQLWLGLTDRRMDIHRRLGLIYLAGVSVGSLAGLYMAFTTTYGFLFGAGLAGLAVAWILTTGLAFTAIKRAQYDQHKDWMIRSYVVTFAFVFFRVMDPFLVSLRIGPSDAAVFSAWACWAVPLLLTEAVLQGRRIFGVA